MVGQQGLILGPVPQRTPLKLHPWLQIVEHIRMLHYFYRYCIATFDGGILTDTDFKYLMESTLTDGHYLSPCTCKCCNVFKVFDGLNFDGLAGKRQKG